MTVFVTVVLNRQVWLPDVWLISMKYLKEIGCEYHRWLGLAQYCVQ
jgi:hypothetical protein